MPALGIEDVQPSRSPRERKKTATDGVCQAGHDSVITFKAGEKFSNVEVEFELKLEAYREETSFRGILET